MEPQLPSLDPCHLEAGKKITRRSWSPWFFWARQNSKTCRFDYAHIVSTASIPGIATLCIMIQSVQLCIIGIMHWSTVTCASFPPGETHAKSWRLFTKQSSMASEPFIWFNTSLDQEICTSLNPTNCRKKSHWPILWSFVCKDPTLGTSKPYTIKNEFEKKTPVGPPRISLQRRATKIQQGNWCRIDPRPRWPHHHCKKSSLAKRWDRRCPFMVFLDRNVGYYM